MIAAAIASGHKPGDTKTTCARLKIKNGKYDQPVTITYLRPWGEGQRVTIPTGVSLFPKELPTPPRSWVERVYNITYWEKANKGGHFAAMENPKLFAEHLNHFFHSLSIHLKV